VIRVVLADDQLLVRQGIGGLLAMTGDIEVVGEAADGLEAVDVVMRTKPDVGLFDVRMPVATGIDALRELKKRKVELRTIMLTTFDDDAALKEAIREGACGWLLKDVSLEALADAVRKVASGGTLVMPMTAAAGETIRMEATEFPSSEQPSQLTARELEVLRLIARGMSNREIAETNGTSEGTVKNQTSSILQKLGVRDRTRAVLKAAELGLLMFV
jgi:DNA-binding NarL/FixJ family response regulator